MIFLYCLFSKNNKRNHWLHIYASTLRKKCLNTELFLVRIFLYSNWIQKLRTRNFSVFEHFSRSGKLTEINQATSKCKWKFFRKTWFKNRKSAHHYLILYIRISLSTKFQVKPAILNFSIISNKFNKFELF